MHSAKSDQRHTASELAGILAEVTEKLQAGASLDLDGYVNAFPQHADQLRVLLPTMRTLADVGGSQEATDSMAPVEQLDLVNHLVGDFRVLRELGRGGMGIVYEAEQISLRRPVALKVLPFAAILDQSRLQRFKNESRAAAALRHSNIVPIYSVGSVRGLHFYAMQLIEGASLAEVITDLQEDVENQRATDPSARSGVDQQTATSGETNLSSLEAGGRQSAIATFPVAALSTQRHENPRAFYQTIARLGIDVAEALHHAHEQGVIHRDVKPGNILIDGDGKPWVTDFGLARIATETTMTLAGDLLGTLRYMSPEQAGGDQALVDHRTDIYSLGISLYELAALRPAFVGTQREQLLLQIASENPPQPRQIAPQIPRDLETIILKASAKVPAARYASAAALADDLRRFIERRPIVARRQSRISRATDWARRNRAMATLGSLALLMLTTLAIGGPIVAYQQAQAARKESRLVSRLEQITNRQSAIIYARDIKAASQAISQGNFLEGERVLERCVPERGQADPRSFEWYYLWNLCHDPAIERTIRHEASCHHVAFLDGGKRLAVSWFSDVSIWDLTQPSIGLPSSKLLGHVAGAAAVLPVPRDERLLTADHGGHVRLWDADTSEQLDDWQADLPPGKTRIHTLDLSPDGRFWAVGSGNFQSGHVRVFDREQHAFCPPLDDLPGAARCVFTSGGHLVVGCSNSNQLCIHNYQQGAMDRSLELSGNCESLAVSADRKRLAVGTTVRQGAVTYGHVEWGDPHRWQHRHRVVLPCKSALAVAFSQDATLLAVGEPRGQFFIIDAVRGEVLVRKQAHFENIDSLAFSPDGRLLATASGDGHVHLWRVADLLNRADHTVREFTLEAGGAQTSVFLDGGERIATADQRGTVFIWDAETTEVVRTIPAPARRHQHVPLSRVPRRSLSGRVPWLLAVERKYPRLCRSA